MKSAPGKLAGKGWSSSLQALSGTGVPVILVVRSSALEEVLARLAPEGAPVWEVDSTDAAAIAEAVGASLGHLVGSSIPRGQMGYGPPGGEPGGAPPSERQSLEA